MKRLMSLPMSAEILAEYGGPSGLAAACRALDCDGLEVVWAGEDLPWDVPLSLHVGYHLTFFPDWLDFWRGDRRALKDKFGGEVVWRAFYGGPEGPETLLKLYREDLGRALAWEPSMWSFMSLTCQWRRGIPTAGFMGTGRSSTPRWRSPTPSWRGVRRARPS